MNTWNKDLDLLVAKIERASITLSKAQSVAEKANAVLEDALTLRQEMRIELCCLWDRLKKHFRRWPPRVPIDPATKERIEDIFYGDATRRKSGGKKTLRCFSRNGKAGANNRLKARVPKR